MLNKRPDPRYIGRLIYEAKKEAQRLHPNVLWEIEESGYHINISSKKDGGTITVRFQISPKQLIGEDFRILVNKMAGFL